jgi:hypothetical protein
MENVETFGSPLLADVAFNDDGTLKQSGKQNVKFYNKKRLSFRARPKYEADGVTPQRDASGKIVFDIDPKTGLPHKDAFEEIVEFVRVETKGDTNIKDDVADELSKRQFYRQYKHFREGKIPDGNPIEDFDFLQPPTVMELHMLGIHVIQQVAAMSDMDCERLKDQSGYEIRDIASQWMRINSPDGQASKATRLEMENARLKRQLEDSQSARGQRRSVAAPVEAAPVVEEAEATLEISAEDMAAKRSGRPRKV